MTTYALIERNSGYIWGVAEAESPTEACRIVDENEANEYGLRYAEVSRSDDWTFAVYEMPAGWECDDGQNEDEIADVSAHKVAAYVAAKAANEIEYRVVYYYPDGHWNADEVRFTGTDDECFDYIREEIGGKYGTWTDVDGNLCYHESEEIGCGGYYIEEAR